MTDLQIRPAAPDDREACLTLLTLLRGSETPGAGVVFDQLISATRGEVIVAELKHQIVGMASVSYNIAMRYAGEYCQLEELIVNESARGFKAGGALVSATIERARARGCGEYGLYLVEQTEGNQPFYEKYGLIRVGSEMRMVL